MTKKVFLLLTIVFLVASISAVCKFESGALQKSYATEDNIKGYITMDFTDESVDALFTDSNQNQISLKDLALLSNLDKFCEIAECSSSYSESIPDTSKIFKLNNGETKLLGIKLVGDIEKINSVEMEILSDAPRFCSNQIEVDFFDDKRIESTNSKPASDTCGSKNYGCFNPSSSTTELIISETPYCQKITLSNASGFSIGAKVIPSSETAIMRMTLYNKEKTIMKICDLPKITKPAEYSCNIDLNVVGEEDYYVCISGSGDYKIPSSIGSDVCGFQGTPTKKEVASYYLFAQPRKYDAPDKLELPSSESLASSTEGYLKKMKGDSMNCGESGCIIPIRIKANLGQQIKVRNILVSYEISGGSLQGKEVSFLTETPSRFNANDARIYFDKANFTSPNKLGENTYELKFKGDTILSEKFSVERIPTVTGVIPETTVAGYPTKLKAVINNSDKEVKSYVWNIDGETEETSENEITHTFTSLGSHEVQITLIDAENRNSSKTLSVEVSTSKEIIDDLIKKDIASLEEVKKQVDEFPSFYSDSLSSILKLDELNSKISAIQVNYNKAKTEDEYVEILSSLLELDFPQEVFVSKKVDAFAFYNNQELIDLNFLSEIGRGAPGSNEEAYTRAVDSWNKENLDTKYNLKEITLKSEGGTKPIATFLELDINKKGNFNYPFYLVIDELEGFSSDSSNFQKKDGYIYFNLDDSEKINFVSTEEIDMTDIPVFISPELVNLNSESVPDYEKKTSKWVWFILIVVGILLIFSLIYLYLRSWYKKKYEDSLFKNKNDLYNLVSYIQKEKTKGASNNKIAEKLRKTGWSSEKINYILKKYAGKKIGTIDFSEPPKRK